MKLQEIQLNNFAPPGRWKEIEHSGGKKHLMLRLGHINPETHKDPVNSQANKVLKQEKKGNVQETTSTVGISTARGVLSDFYDGMIAMSQAGFLPGFSVEKIEEHRRKMNEQMPEECDFWTEITIADYNDEKISSQALVNIKDQFTKGFADVAQPGALNNMSLKDAFKNPLVRQVAKERGVSGAEMDKALEEISQASSQAVKQVAESNVKYVEGSFHKLPAIYVIPPKQFKPKPQPRKKSGKGGAGGSDPRVKFPASAFKKEDYPIGGKILQAIQVGKYLISGGLLNALSFMPSKNAFCQSLTKFKTTTETTKEGDMTFIDHFIVPVNSNLGTEGYFNREETEEMVMKIIALLK
jgi:hypothetical protein